MTERIEYDEFSYFHENAREFGLPFDGPPAVRRVSVELPDGRQLSALVWGAGEPELVLIHGGAQNAHTWDTVALALDRPLVAIDLPGHGHSDGPDPHAGTALGPMSLAADVAVAVRALAPDASGVVGMSLGGVTSIGLSAVAPELVRSLTLVDVTPGVDKDKAKAITAFVNGPKSFPSFADILARTIEHNPTRTVESLRRGILHNAVQLEDGSWEWRYRRWDAPAAAEGAPADRHPEFGSLWDVLGAVTVPVMLVRGMRPQSVVDDADEAELLRRLPDAQVVRIAEAGHSVQGDTPVELARLLEGFALGRR